MEDPKALKFMIDWELDKKEFQASISEMIKNCMEQDKVISLPIEINPGPNVIGLLSLLLGQIDCTNCNNKCCVSGENNRIELLPKEYQILASKFGKQHFINYYSQAQDATGYAMQFPCPFLAEHKCSIYGDRPLICALFPFQDGGFAGEHQNNYVYALASSCPEGRRIARQVYMTFWRLRRLFNRGT